MKKVFLICMIAIKIVGYAQNGVAINTTGAAANSNAMLDVSATNKGMLVPRVNLVTLTSNSLSAFGISATPVTSLLVYNTTASTLPSTIFQIGFYYWEGSNWIKLNTGATSSAATGWGLTGNSGTNPNINFIGTLDDNDIVFKRNNAPSGRINLSAANTSFGLGALNIATSGAANTAFGAYNLQTNTTGYGNTAAGTYALATNNVGFNNTANGYNALINNSIGNNNTANGKDALFSNTSGYSNVAVGISALNKSTVSNHNVAIGDSALFYNADGLAPHPIFGLGPNGKNTAVGSKTLYANISGRENTAVGYESMKLADAYLNTAIGSYSLFNSTGQSNVALGASALFSNSTGQNNTAFGTFSLNNNTTGSYNTGVGFQASTNTVNLVNATAIGAQARVDCSNCLVLGSKNTINGATSDVNVGIGNTAPVYRLDVIGKQKIYGAPIANSILGGVTNGALLLENNSNSYQTLFDGDKIQSQKPDALFGTVFSDININPKGGAVAIGLGTNLANARLHIEKPPIGTLGGQVPSAVQINGTQFNTVFNYGGQEEISIQSGKTGSTVSINTVSNGNILLGGNVGISNSTPTAKLDIVTAGSTIKPHIRMYEFNNGYARLEFKNSTGNNYWHIAGYNNPTNSNERLNFHNNTMGNVMSITGDGKVGIGLDNPSSPLSFPATFGKKISLFAGALGDAGMGVFGNELRLHSDYVFADITFGYDDYVNGFTEKMRIKGNGNVGIGIANPNEKLAVNGRIRSKEVLVEAAFWPDFVFDENYKLPTLNEVEKFIATNKHLPDLPSATEVETNGQNLGDVQKKLLQKVEELTLYIIEQNKRIEKLEAEKLKTTKN
jgi:trimeric autotransporter adhesin